MTFFRILFCVFGLLLAFFPTQAQSTLTPISQLQVGDEVLAIAEWKDKGSQAKQDQRLSYEKVTDIFTSFKEQTLVHLTLGNGEQITATEGHPFNATEGWRDAVMLKKGGKLLLKGGDADSEAAIEITEIRTERKTLPVYNIEVANAHTYFVGIDGVGVHNAIPGGCNKIPGIYRFMSNTGKEYIGKAKDLAKRLAQHEKSDLLPKGNMPTVQKMPGSSDLQRRIAEQRAINSAGGAQSQRDPLQNEINSISPANQLTHGLTPLP